MVKTRYKIAEEGDCQMEVEFKCTSDACCKRDQKETQLVLPAEMVMDDRNIAVIYCPECNCQLERSKET